MKSSALVDATLRAASTAPCRLVLVNLSKSPLNGWWEFFRQNWESSQKAEINNLTDFKSMLEGVEQIYGLVCVANPASRVEALINSGKPPAQALASWRSESEALLALYRRHYGRMTIADSACLALNVRRLRQYLAERANIPLKAAELDESYDAGEVSATDSKFNPLSRLLALQALTQPEAMQVCSELEASSLPLSNNVNSMKLLDEIYAEFMAGNLGGANSIEKYSEENMRLRADLHKTQIENERVISQLMRTQEKLEECLVARQDHSDIVTDLNRKIRSLKNSAVKMSAETQLTHTRLGNSVKELQRVNNQLRKELKEREEAARRQQRARSKVSAELARAAAELNLVYSSRSWRLTSPLRKAARFFRSRRGDSV